MCLIISGDKKIPLNEAFITNVIARNDDGFGMMWVEGEEVKTLKSMEKNPGKILKIINEVYQYNPFIHFRMRTHGDVDLSNCHPYDCGNGIYLMHNGVLSHGNKSNEAFSDTWHFIEDILKPLFQGLKDPSDYLRTHSFHALIKNYIGYSNRLVFMDKHGPALINHDTWVKVQNVHTGVEGLFVSNAYAWSEYSFRDPNYQPNHTPRGKNGRWTKGEPCETVYVSDRFKDKFEEYQHPFYLDDNWNVWEQKGRGFKRRKDLHWEDLSAIPQKGEPTSLREMVDSTVTATNVVNTPKDIVVHDHTPQQMELPALVCAPPNLTGEQAALICQEDKNEEEEEHLTTVINSSNPSPATITPEVYEQLLLNTYAKYSSWEIERRVQEDPDEAIGLFQRLLRSIST